MTKIRDNLYLGDRNDVQEAKSNGITAILNVAAEIDDPDIDGIVNKKVGFRDTAQDAALHTDKAIVALKELIDSGKIVLVHCRMGKSRSPHIVAEYLSEAENKDYFDLYDSIGQMRDILDYSLGEEILNKNLD